VRHLAIVGLVLLTAAAYHNSLTGAFVFDDVPAIAENPTIRALWPLSGALSPPDNSGVGGRPLANLSFALNHALHGTSVVGYHVGNLLLHLGSTLLLFGIVRRTLHLVFGDTGRGLTGLALAAAACWGVHPLTTASVSYLSQRTELLMGFFLLSTLYAFLRGATGGGKAWLAVSVAACVAGMLSKEVMAVAPVIVLLFDRTFLAGTFADAWRRRRIYYFALATTWLPLGYLLTTGLAQRSVGYGLGVSALDYALTEGRAILHYLRLAVVPHPLVFDYGPVYAPSVGAVLVIALLVGFTIWLVVRGSRVGFAAACFFLLLAPTSSIVPVAEQPIAENRIYLPLAALIGLGVVSLAAVLGGRRKTVELHRGADPVRGLPRGAIAGGCLVIAALALLTLRRNADYRTALTLWTDTVEKRPQNWRAQFNHGVTLLNLDRSAEAVASFERAIALRPSEAKVHFSLGNALLAVNRLPEAIARYTEAVRLDPNHARALSSLGAALLRSGDAPGAIARLERALQIDPTSPETLQALGNVYFQRDQPARAITYYESALRIEPTLADAHYNAGSAGLELGRIEDAIRHFAAAAKLKPADPEIRNNLGAALVRAGRGPDAIREFEHALKLKPDYTDARENLDVARRELRRAK
jgi:tetratricopeptide (TPR) repeat protein